MAEKTKEARINAELKRLQEKFTLADQNQQDVIGPLLQNAAFMSATLQDLQEIINRDGPVDTYQNGANQYGTKPSAAVQSYNNLAKTYSGILIKLASLLPPEKKTKAPTTLQALKTMTAEEEAEAEAEKLRQRQEEMKLAGEYQRQRKEYTGPKSAWPNFSTWRAMPESSRRDLTAEAASNAE